MGKLNKQASILALMCLLGVPNSYANSVQPLFTSATTVEMTDIPSFKVVGTAKMKWLWFEVYDAILRTPTGAYQVDQWPLSLDLTYKQNISAEQLIQSTIEDWQRQKISYSADWTAKLKLIWPDIASQDQLILYVDEARISHFFFNKKFIGSINDPLFSTAFTAIWLSKNTIKPAQRNQLIGINP
ncbi:MAG: hypothetical protein ACKVJI_08985 [Pseudomonadales bacterium]|jgi:hypothetical protein|tara:strand:+ start:11732 stop:12286 length:555 start_codon:yes stop_codon:yes gene_type:complete